MIHLGPHDLQSILPETILAGAGCVLVLLEAFLPALRRTFATLAILATGLSVYALTRVPEGMTFSGMHETSPLVWALTLFVSLAAILTILVARPYLERNGQESGEFYALLLWGHAGVLLMGRSVDLLMIFIGLETLSLAFYVLAAYFKKMAASTEAGLKYFLTGALASAFTLYGIALLFGSAGTTRLSGISGSPNTSNPLFGFGLLFLIAGFGFKMSLAPFHAWAPDVYAGMPTPAVAYLSVAPKGIALVVLFRIFSAAFGDALPGKLRTAVAAVAVLSMVLGNLVALAQRDIKRLLAYSGIAHMGYVAIALAVFGREALAAVLIYLFAYAVSNGGAFAAVAALYRDESKPHPVGLLAGEGRRAPFGAFALALCMISLTGIPATAGFIGKFFVFKAAIERDLLWLAIVGVINTLVSIGYYLRVVYVLYMREAVEPVGPPPLAPGSRLALALSVAGILVFGVYPVPLLRLAEEALQGFPFFR